MSFLPSFLPSLLRTYVCPYRWMDDADGFIPFRPLCVLLCVGVPLITFENVRYPSNDSRLEYDHNIHVSVPVRGCTLSNTPNLCSEPDRSRSNLKYSTDCTLLGRIQGTKASSSQLTNVYVCSTRMYQDIKTPKTQDKQGDGLLYQSL